jgi:flagellar biosynthesis chaperone FliJ
MADEQKETGLTKVEIAKNVFKMGHDLMEKYEEDAKIELSEIMEEIQEFMTNVYKDYRD